MADREFDELLQILIEKEETLFERNPSHPYAHLFPRSDNQRQRFEDFMEQLEPFRPEDGSDTDILVEVLAKIEDELGEAPIPPLQLTPAELCI